MLITAVVIAWKTWEISLGSRYEKKYVRDADTYATLTWVINQTNISYVYVNSSTNISYTFYNQTNIITQTVYDDTEILSIQFQVQLFSPLIAFGLVCTYLILYFLCFLFIY